MTKGFRAAALLFCLGIAFCLGISSACVAAAKPKPKAPAAAPATPEAGWFLGHDKDRLRLFYGMADGSDTVIIFSCAQRSGDVVIHVPIAAGKMKADQSQSVSLTIGGVKSSFAGAVVENQDGSMTLEVTVTARNPMFTSLSGPGGMRLEGKSFSKIVPLKIGDKLKQFLGGCRK